MDREKAEPGDLQPIQEASIWAHWEFCICDEDPNGLECDNPTHPRPGDQVFIRRAPA